MKLIVEKKYLDGSAEQFIQRSAAYAHIHSHHTDHDSYVRRLTRDYYPRLHMYIKDLGDKVEFNLHLDQKQTSYGGAHAHNAEYDGEVVEGEIARLKNLIRAGMPQKAISQSAIPSGPSAEKRLGHGDYHKPVAEENKGFFRRLFG